MPTVPSAEGEKARLMVTGLVRLGQELGISRKANVTACWDEENFENFFKIIFFNVMSSSPYPSCHGNKF